MRLVFQATVLIAAVLMLTEAEAANYPLGKSKQNSPEWPDKLKDVANDPARYDGSTSLGRFDFWYEGEAKDIQRVLDLYAKVKEPRIHLTVGVGDPAADL